MSVSLLSNTNVNGNIIDKTNACYDQQDFLEFKNFSSYSPEENKFIVRVQVDNFVHCYDIRSIIDWVVRKKLSGQPITCPTTRQNLSCIADELLDKAEHVIPNFVNPFKINTKTYDGTNHKDFIKDIETRIANCTNCEAIQNVEDFLLDTVHTWRMKARRSPNDKVAFYTLQEALHNITNNTNTKSVMDLIQNKKESLSCDTLMSRFLGGKAKSIKRNQTKAKGANKTSKRKK